MKSFITILTAHWSGIELGSGAKGLSPWELSASASELETVCTRDFWEDWLLLGPHSMMAASDSLLMVMTLGGWVQGSPSTCTGALDNRSMEICKTHPHRGKVVPMNHKTQIEVFIVTCKNIFPVEVYSYLTYFILHTD